MVEPRQADASDALITRKHAKDKGNVDLSKGLKEGRRGINKEERKLKKSHHFKEIIQTGKEGLQLVP